MHKIGIICAADRELNPFLQHIDHVAVSKKAMLKFYEGTISGVPVVALYSGVCKVNAAIAAQILVDVYEVDTMINAGTAGGMDSSVHLFDTVISTQVAYHDIDDDVLTKFHPWMSSRYFTADANLLKIADEICAENKNVRLGRMVTGEKFIEDHMRNSINQKYAPLSVDMETAGIAQVCYVNGIPFISIHSITDTAEHPGAESFDRNCSRAAVIAKDVVLSFIAKLGDQWVRST